MVDSFLKSIFASAFLFLCGTSSMCAIALKRRVLINHLNAVSQGEIYNSLSIFERWFLFAFSGAGLSNPLNSANLRSALWWHVPYTIFFLFGSILLTAASFEVNTILGLASILATLAILFILISITRKILGLIE